MDIPDDDTLHTDLCATIWGRGATRFNSNQQIVLEPKDHIKERVGFSPDGGDAAALTFAFPVQLYIPVTVVDVVLKLTPLKGGIAVFEQ